MRLTISWIVLRIFGFTKNIGVVRRKTLLWSDEIFSDVLSVSFYLFLGPYTVLCHQTFSRSIFSPFLIRRPFTFKYLRSKKFNAPCRRRGLLPMTSLVTWVWFSTTTTVKLQIPRLSLSLHGEWLSGCGIETTTPPRANEKVDF